MKIITNHENTYLLRFDRGEEVLEKLRQFCTENEIYGGTFSGLGAASHVTLADYDLTKKEYRSKEFAELLEIASLTGNVALDGKEVMLHAHGVFSNLQKVHGGHIMKLVVGVNCEISLTVFPEAISREHDNEIGLKLLI